MRLQERVQIAIRSAGYSLSTERSYWDWIKRFIKFQKSGSGLSFCITIVVYSDKKSYLHNERPDPSFFS